MSLDSKSHHVDRPSGNLHLGRHGRRMCGHPNCILSTGDDTEVYFSGAHPDQGNRSHRTLVLRSHNPDPMISAGWEFLGPLKGMPDHWAIDATIFGLGRKLFCCWSAWPSGDTSDTEQDLMLIELENAEQAIGGSILTLSRPLLNWERLGNRGINEGPQFVSTPSFTGIVYSANGSWTRDYKLGVMQLVGPDPLKLECWDKWQQPLMMSDPQGNRGPHGPGHASLVFSSHVDDGLHNLKFH
ncbi:MAG: hypothetical protein Q9227_007496 [Pyrenula ochraceoflavens]